MRRIEGEPVFDMAPSRERKPARHGYLENGEDAGVASRRDKKPHRGQAPGPEPVAPQSRPQPARRPALLDPETVKSRSAPAPEAGAPEAAPLRKARWSTGKKQAHKAAAKPSAPLGPKSAGFKSHGALSREERPARGEGAEARPKRAAGFKSHKTAHKAAGNKPFRDGPKAGRR